MTVTPIRIPRSVADQIGYYVYLYIDPRNRRPFYVGKGKGARALAHLVAAGDSRKVAIIRELRQAGLEPQIDILAHGLSQDAALRLESAAIDLLKLEKVANRYRGWRSVELGRMPLRQLITYYRPVPVRVVDPVILIRINKLYKHGMSDPDFTRPLVVFGKSIKSVFAERSTRSLYLPELYGRCTKF